MTKIEELQQILQAQSELAEALCAVLSQKQQAIVRFRGDALADATGREERLLEPLEKLEQERLLCTASISASLAAPATADRTSPPKLRELIALLDAGDASKVAPLATRLREAVESLLSLNSQNKTLLNHSLHFVKETLRIITDDHKKQLIDQRI